MRRTRQLLAAIGTVGTTALALLATAAPAAAQTHGWTFSGSGSNCSFTTGSAGSVGNAYTCRVGTTVGAPTVRITGWSLVGSTLQAAGVAGPWSGSGIGVLFAGENAANANHAVDSEGRADFLLFDFGTPHVLQGVTIGWTSNDSDFMLWRWSGVGAMSTTAFTASGTFLNAGTGAEAVNGAGAASRYWALSAGGTDGRADYLKVQGVTATASVVPEPSTWAMMGAGLVGLGAAARRRKR